MQRRLLSLDRSNCVMSDDQRDESYCAFHQAALSHYTIMTLFSFFSILNCDIGSRVRCVCASVVLSPAPDQ